MHADEKAAGNWETRAKKAETVEKVHEPDQHM